MRRSITSCLRACERPRSSDGHPGVDAEVGRPLDGAQHLGRLEELLGRDAAPVQAGPADPALLDERDVEPGGRAVERGRVAGRTAAEDHDVELLGQDGHLLEFTGTRASSRRPGRHVRESRHSSRRNPESGHSVPEHSLDRYGRPALTRPPPQASRISGRGGSAPRRR